MRKQIVGFGLAMLLGGFHSAVAEGSGRTAFGLWKGGSVVYTLIEGVETLADGQTLLKLKPVATLIGPLDPRTEASIAAKVKIGSVGTSIHKAPQARSYAVVVLLKKGTEYEVDSFPQPFMPNGTAIEPLKGDPTPVMLKTLNSIQEMRVKKQ
ncbi:MAG: hypothetical protein HZA88_14325 [Verrucomicrobia bacterium]|nr:hypothetical protein [Verrucomicrobiota bacterium]